MEMVGKVERMIEPKDVIDYLKLLDKSQYSRLDKKRVDNYWDIVTIERIDGRRVVLKNAHEVFRIIVGDYEFFETAYDEAGRQEALGLQIDILKQFLKKKYHEVEHRLASKIIAKEIVFFQDDGEKLFSFMAKKSNLAALLMILPHKTSIVYP